MIRRALLLALVALLVGATAFFSVRYMRQRSVTETLATETAKLKRELATVHRTDKTALARARYAARSASQALDAAQRRIGALESLPTTTVPSPVALADPALLVSDLTQAMGQLTGLVPTSAQEQLFVVRYHDLQLKNAQLEAAGSSYVQLDPMSEAEAFIQQTDQGAVIAANAAKVDNLFNCYATTGNPACGTSG